MVDLVIDLSLVVTLTTLAMFSAAGSRKALVVLLVLGSLSISYGIAGAALYFTGH